MASESYAVGYHHLALVCTNVAASIDFYTKLGFQLKEGSESGPDAAVLYSQAGLELHLFHTSTTSVGADKIPHNILMDDPETKYPGHTHFCIGVGSVPQTREYLKSMGIAESGSREMFGKYVASVFVRDPDRTVVELERNDGQDDNVPVTPETLSKAARRGIDHIGTRVTKVPTTAEWYRKHLGLVKDVYVSDVDLEHPEKNFRPWILRSPPDDTEVAVDINLIPNGTTETPCNILLTSGKDNKEPLPGILYVCYQVTSIEGAIKGLDASEIANSPDELAAWGVSAKFVQEVGTKSCFVRDMDHCLFRLIEV
jgi:catechol 2,3-dioxygenase-like lactoylglutathione lyase family enzyme